MDLTLDAFSEFEGAVAKCEKSVVFATSYILTRMKMGAPLTYDDIARLHRLATEHFDAKSLCVRVTAVTGRAKTFLMSHCLFLRCLLVCGVCLRLLLFVCLISRLIF